MPDRCCVYNCKSGYDPDIKFRKENGLPQLSQFRPKKGLLNEWEKRISRGNGWKMSPKHTVCELHFEKQYIKSKHEFKIGDTCIAENREKKMLTDDAVPTIFDGYPSYKNFKVSSRKRLARKEPTDTLRTQAKRIKRGVDESLREVEEMVVDDPSLEERASEKLSILCDRPLTFSQLLISEPQHINRPSANWHIHRGPSFVSFVHINSEGTQIDRFVKFHGNTQQPEICMINRKILEDTNVGSYDEVAKLLQRVQNLEICSGVGVDNKWSDKCLTYLEAGGLKKRIAPRCFQCAEKKKAVAKGIRRGLARKFKQAKKKVHKHSKIKLLTKKVIIRNKKITKLKEKIENLATKCALLKKETVNEYIKNMPKSWQNAILACVTASKAKSSYGRRYTTNWIYECQLLRIKSLKLYKKMLRDNFLPVPSLRTLQRYMKKLSPAYGFQTNIFEMMKEKSPLLREAERHGALLIDEISLSEGIWFDKYSLKLQGFVNLDQFTPEGQKDVPADHALVIMFQPFQCQYFQTISAHLSKGAVKGPELAKLVLEATRLMEEAGYFVDAIVGDAAPWNRNMWSQFGLKKFRYEREQSKTSYEVDDPENIEEDFDDENFDSDLAQPTTKEKRKKASLKKRTAKKKKRCIPEEDIGVSKVASCVHPVEGSRRLWFVSDFPHLVKSMKQRIVNAEKLQTPDGLVQLKHWYIVCKEDEKRGIKVAPRLSMRHFQTETYLAMNVGMAFSFFSEEVATGMEHYKRLGVRGMEDCDSTVKFIRNINVLIDALNSNSRKEGLKSPADCDVTVMDPPVCPECKKTHSENTPQRKKTARQVLEDFLVYLDKWETSGVARDKRLTASAAYGLRITITSALELSSYLINELKYEYFMTRRINQDRLEHFFGEIRQGCGAHGHPDPAQFIQVYRLMSFKSLVKPPKGSNVTGGEMLSSLLSLPDHRSIENKKRQIQLETELDEVLDIGQFIYPSNSNSEVCESLQTDKSAMRMFGGYVARKARKSSYAKECEECFESLRSPQEQPLQEDDDIIHSRSKGYLLVPSDSLMDILETLEICVLEVLKNGHLHTDIFFEVTNYIKGKSFHEIGCEEHKRKLTKAIISFYICTRLIFACEEFNKKTSENAKKKQKAKQQQKLFRLTC